MAAIAKQQSGEDVPVAIANGSSDEGRKEGVQVYSRPADSPQDIGPQVLAKRHVKTIMTTPAVGALKY